MPKARSLTSFLKQEVRKTKLKVVEAAPNTESAFEKLNRDYEMNKRLAKFKADNGFTSGSDRKKAKTRAKAKPVVEEKVVDDDDNEPTRKQKERLQRFLAEEQAKKTESKKEEYATDKHKKLAEVKIELASFVECEEEFTPYQRWLVKGRKTKLIADIAALEAQVTKIDIELRKAKSSENLPAPMDFREQKNLAKAVKIVAKAKSGIPPPSAHLKRKRFDRELSAEHDGEDRLYMGKRIKKVEFEFKGFWVKENRPREPVVSPRVTKSEKEEAVRREVEKVRERTRVQIEKERAKIRAQKERQMERFVALGEEMMMDSVGDDLFE